MKFGMNLLLWTGDLTDEHAAGAGEAQEDGLRRRRDADLRSRSGEVRQAGASGSTTWAWRARAVTVRSAADNPISPDAKIRAAGVDANKKTLDCCQAAGAQTLVRTVSLGHRRVQRHRPHGRRMEVGRRQHAAGGRARRQVRRDAGRRVSQSLRVLLAQHGRRRGPLRATT